MYSVLLLLIFTTSAVALMGIRMSKWTINKTPVAIFRKLYIMYGKIIPGTHMH